jgi:alpha-D-ribose 1-methylphosphonate 5-triphosphate diphosphatase
MGSHSERETAMSNVLKIGGGRIVTPHGILDNHTLILEDGKIAAILHSEASGVPDMDVEGRWIFPGIIDTHSDAIESEVQPRPTSQFPFDLSLYELERKLASQGITTIYHCLGMLDDRSKNLTRQNDYVLSSIRALKEFALERRLIRHRIHLRFEITNLSAVEAIRELLEKGDIDQISFMDHTPGQGQWRSLEAHKALIMGRQGISDAEAEEMLNARRYLPKASGEVLSELAWLAKSKRIPLASHDDDSVEKLDLVEAWEASIAEFPIKLDVAVEARKRGLFVAMGAPNVLLGRSHSDNLSALDAIRAGVVDILCSDYYPPSLLQAVFRLKHEGIPVHQAVNMVSLNPALALGIAANTGSLEAGKEADLLIVAENGGRPVLEKVFVSGSLVCQMSYPVVVS